MRSSRRVLILTVVAVVCGAVIVGVALVGLATPREAVEQLRGRVLPATVALDKARAAATLGQDLFLGALTSPPDQRNVLIADAQINGALGTAAMREYRQLALGSPAELELQQRYKEQVRLGQGVGAQLFSLADSPTSTEYQAVLANERELFAGQIALIDEIERRFYGPRVRGELITASNGLDATRRAILVAFAAVFLLGVLNAAILLIGALRQERVIAARDADRIEGARRADLENQLQRGLEMVPTEGETYAVIAAALADPRAGTGSELLLADSSRAHFRQVLATGVTSDDSGCGVPSPLECPAASSGQARLFLSGTRLDACPFLRDRDNPRRSASCVPLSIAGATNGVIHTTGPDGELPTTSELADLDLVARKAGERIGFLRVLERTETHARIDTLTGLLNRRSIDYEAHEILQQGGELVVAYADLDHFKALNDEHGHETGDRALRLFGRVLRDSVRPSDVPGRYGGEEFIVLLPACTLPDAEFVMNRIRQRLATATASETEPGFTVSIGLAAWMPSETYEGTVARADAALLEAKATGRDRVVLSHEPPSDGPDQGEASSRGAPNGGSSTVSQAVIPASVSMS